MNHALKRNEWWDIFGPYDNLQNTLVHEALDLICDTYEIDLGCEICFSYKTYTTCGKSYKWIRLTANDRFLLKDKNIRCKNQESKPLELKDLLLHCVIHKGITMIRDTTCDSEYMLKHIQEIGRAIRQKLDWIEMNIPIFLIMDNATTLT